jgi:hypothetical protein
VPGAFCEGHELDEFAVTADQCMGGYAQRSDFQKRRMRPHIQAIAEQRFYVRCAEFTFRQADAVYDNQLRLADLWALIAILGRHAANAFQPPLVGG